jgi:hypothetical protein
MREFGQTFGQWPDMVTSGRNTQRRPYDGNQRCVSQAALTLRRRGLGRLWKLIRVGRLTNVSDTSDPEPCFIGVTGVNPGKATAEGGLGLMPVTPMQALSMGGWNKS